MSVESDRHLSSFELDQLALEALPPDAIARAEAHLRDCARCAGERDQLAAARARFSSVVFARTRERVTGAATPWWRRPRFVALVPTLALAAALLFMLTPSWDPLESTCRHASLSIL